MWLPIPAGSANPPKLPRPGKFAHVDGDIGNPTTASNIVKTALSRFKSIDAVVNNAGIIFTKALHRLQRRRFQLARFDKLAGFLYLTQLSLKQMLAHFRQSRPSADQIRHLGVFFNRR